MFPTGAKPEPGASPLLIEKPNGEAEPRLTSGGKPLGEKTRCASGASPAAAKGLVFLVLASRG